MTDLNGTRPAARQHPRVHRRSPRKVAVYDVRRGCWETYVLVAREQYQGLILLCLLLLPLAGLGLIALLRFLTGLLLEVLR